MINFYLCIRQEDQTKMLQRTVQQTANLPQGDFPSMAKFREKVEKYEIWKFPKLDKKLVTTEQRNRDVQTALAHHTNDSKANRWDE